MNRALHAQGRNDVSSRWYRQQSMAVRKHSKVWLHFSKCDDYARCIICYAKCKASSWKTSDLRQHLVKHKAEECKSFVSLRSTAETPAFSTVSMPASVSDSSSAARNMGEQMFKTTEILQYKQLGVVMVYNMLNK
ncbi:hypothetical protein ILYODFUR_024728 [Ilyodon furcidens]|uniref:BED-type domain-containing protein n=1 Tax=Ilyodon furcidens TaxID=33524 RepID=A0ABV0UUV4_9TELE